MYGDDGQVLPHRRRGSDAGVLENAGERQVEYEMKMSELYNHIT